MEMVLRMYYRLIEQYYLANVTIYNDKGLLVKKRLRIAVSIKLVIRYGLNEAGSLSKVGVYVIKFEVFNLVTKL